MSRRVKTAFGGNRENLDRVYKRTRALIEQEAEVLPGIVTGANIEERLAELRDVEVLFSTWGIGELKLTNERLASLPSLKAVCYGAGSVKSFAAPLLQRGIRVFSAWRANAVPVAEFTLAHLLLGCKGYLRNASLYTSPDWRRNPASKSSPGNYGEKVALIGFGAIAQLVLELLQPFRLEPLVVPFLDRERVELTRRGVRQVTVEEAFRQALIVSNHMANLPVNQRLLNREHFASMRENAVFINTGRGAQVDEEGLSQVLAARPDLTAVLDVTSPEPPVEGSPLYALPNVWLSTHIAGSMNDELQRLAEYALDSFRAYRDGEASPNEVTLDRLNSLA